MTSLTIIAAAFLAVLVAVAAIYNRLVARKNHVLEAWSGIDVQLKRRHDLIPKLVEVVKAYGHYESGLMESVTRLRGEGESGDRAAVENGLSRSLRQLLAVAESYPELKASQLYLDLQSQLSGTEEQIQYARRYYNGTVRELNILVQSFPSNLVARLFGFAAMEYFEIELATQRESPEVNL